MAMSQLVRLCLLCWVSLTCVTYAFHLEGKVKYYRELISSRINDSQFYELPTDYSEYAPNADVNITAIGPYHFIIVGAGSAGCVLANRLSEDKKFNILVIEAGGEEDDFTDLVGLAAYLGRSDKNWGFYTTPQQNSCQARNNNQCVFLKGKSIGGTSVINGVIYSRGMKDDFDFWERQGNVGWSYKHVLPYFKKSERNLFGGNPRYHGFLGPWPSSHLKEISPIVGVFTKASEELHIKNTPDYNSYPEYGISEIQVNEMYGKRYSTGKTFLKPVRNNKNVKVITRAFATKIIFDSSKTTATGVEFFYRGGKYVATCTKELIISGGAVNTPQLLMLSGIGPREHLEQVNIEVIKDLPVGKNLKDHVLFHAVNIRTDYAATPKSLNEIIRDFLYEAKGRLTSPLSQALSFVNIDDFKSDSPNIELFLLPPDPVFDLPKPPNTFNFRDYYLTKYLGTLNSSTDVVVGVIHLKEESSGELTLRSNDPLEFPDISPNLLTDEKDSDMELLYKGIQLVMRLVESRPLKKLNARVVTKVPDCQDLETNSKEYWYCAIRYLSAPTFHVTGTARMGPNETDSVVDHNLKVHGFKNLRVVDASVIPYPVAGHTNAPTIMIAEKISDAIKAANSF